MELILPLATCHCTSHCVMILLFYYLGKYFFSLLGGDTYSLTPGDKLTRQSSVLLALNTTSYMQLADVT